MPNFLILLFFLICCQASQSQQTFNINSGGRDRSFIVYRPDIAADKELPVVFCFHGFTQTGQAMMNYSGFNTLADTYFFMVVYPNGLNFSWNIGQNQPGASTADDVQFTLDIIDFLKENFRIDTKKIYATGFSNGGFFSFKLACELSQIITAIAPVGATINPAQYNNCELARAVPLLQIHGTADFIVSYNGSQGFASVNEIMQFWAEKNRCSTEPVETALPDMNSNDNSTVTALLYPNCNDDIEVVHYRINNGGHTWPSSTAGGLGNINRDISSEDIWLFFDKHSILPNATAKVTDINELYIYPNPGNVFFRLHSNVPGKNPILSIYNLYGSKVYDQHVHSGETINLSHLPDGIYFYQLNNSEPKKLVLVSEAE